jgi:hypothetical protein
MVARLQDPRYPLYYAVELIEYLMKRKNEFEAAGRIIDAVDQSGRKHPLIDKLHSTWLWCVGQRRKALYFAIASAKFWKISFVVHHAGTLYRCMADSEDSAYYRKKSEHYWRLAHSLVDKEERSDAKRNRLSTTSKGIRPKGPD